MAYIPMPKGRGFTPRLVIDNVKILMTAEELAELEAMGQAQPPISPTEAERLSALEAAMLELMMGGTGDG